MPSLIWLVGCIKEERLILQELGAVCLKSRREKMFVVERRRGGRERKLFARETYNSHYLPTIN